MIEDLKAQVTALNDALDLSPVLLRDAAADAQQASTSLTSRVSTIESYVSRLEAAVGRLEDQLPAPGDQGTGAKGSSE